MKHIDWLSGGLAKCLVFVALVALATSAGAAGTEAGWAKVRYVVGHPEFQKAGTPAWQKLERGMILHPGDSVRCDAKSHADLILGFNNGNVEVSPSSELLLEKLTYSYTGLEVIHDTQLNLRSGSVYGQVKKMAAGSKYDVKTPKGVAGIRGTTYAAYADGRLIVTEGCVKYAVLQPDNTFKVFEVCRGFAYDPATNSVREATDAEKKEVNNKALDAQTHGGFKNQWDPRDWRSPNDPVLYHDPDVGAGGVGLKGGPGGVVPFVIFIPPYVEPSISPTTPVAQ